MKRTEALTIKEIMDQYLRSRNMEDKLFERRALDVWPVIVGNAINRNTVERKVENGVMMVRITSAAMRSELQMCRSTLIRSINEAIGKEVISDIRFI